MKLIDFTKGLRKYRVPYPYIIARPCGSHLEAYEFTQGKWVYSKHVGILKRELELKNIQIKDYTMIETEKIIEAYKSFPEYRQFLLTLFGDFIDDNARRFIEQEEEIKNLREKLEECGK